MNIERFQGNLKDIVLEFCLSWEMFLYNKFTTVPTGIFVIFAFLGAFIYALSNYKTPGFFLASVFAAAATLAAMEAVLLYSEEYKWVCQKYTPVFSLVSYLLSITSFLIASNLPGSTLVWIAITIALVMGLILALTRYSYKKMIRVKFQDDELFRLVCLKEYVDKFLYPSLRIGKQALEKQSEKIRRAYENKLGLEQKQILALIESDTIISSSSRWDIERAFKEKLATGTVEQQRVAVQLKDAKDMLRKLSRLESYLDEQIGGYVSEQDMKHFLEKHLPDGFVREARTRWSVSEQLYKYVFTPD